MAAKVNLNHFRHSSNIWPHSTAKFFATLAMLAWRNFLPAKFFVTLAILAWRNFQPLSNLSAAKFFGWVKTPNAEWSPRIKSGMALRNNVRNDVYYAECGMEFDLFYRYYNCFIYSYTGIGKTIKVYSASVTHKILALQDFKDIEIANWEWQLRIRVSDWSNSDGCWSFLKYWLRMVTTDYLWLNNALWCGWKFGFVSQSHYGFYTFA